MRVVLGMLLAVLLEVAPARALAQHEAEDEEVIEVVTTQSPIQEGGDPTPAVYRVTGEALDRPGARMDDVLEQVPGVQTRRGGGAADLASASVRGATSAQTPIYLGGVRLNDDLTGTVDLSTLPLWMLRRVSVFRGAPIGADELGIGGAVRLEPRLSRGVRGRGALGVGSFGEREARGAVSFGDGRSGATLALRHRSSDGDFSFVDDAGTRFDESDDEVRRRANADHAELDVWTVGRVQVEGASITTFLNGFERAGGAPGLQLVGAQRARSEQRRLVGGVSGVVGCGEGFGCALAVDVGVLATRYRLSDPDRELGGPSASEQVGERLTERLRWLFVPADGVELGVGGLLEQQRLGLDAGATRQRARRARVRPETSAVWRITDEVALAAVAALECHHTSAQLGAALGEGETCGVLEPTGRMGARVRALPWMSLFGNVGRYLRVPTLGELYGASATVLGNPALTPERAVSVDAGVNAEGRVGPVVLWGQVVGFARWSDDLINYRRSSFSTLRPFNTDRARTLGGEAAAGATAWRVIELGGAVTLLDPRDVSPERQVTRDLLPFAARLVVAPHVGVVSPAWEAVALDEAALRLTYLHRSSRVADPAGLVILSEQNLLDLDASLALAEMVVVRGRVANLLDQRTVDLVGYPLPGRSFHGMVEARF